MRFWDSSAIVPLLVYETATSRAQQLFEEDTEIIVWWSSTIEVVSALARLERSGTLESSTTEKAIDALSELNSHWHEIQPSNRIREVAVRLLRTHPMRAADSLQLSAAIAACLNSPSTLPFVTFDERLISIARKEGFTALGLK